MSRETVREPEGLTEEAGRAPSGPGLVIVFSGERPCMVPLALREGRTSLGREELEDLRIADDRASRRHLAVERTGSSLVVRDLGSTNGVFVNGGRVVEPVPLPPAEIALIRLGRTLVLAVPELGPYEAAVGRPMVREGVVAGPHLHAAHQQIAALAGAGQPLLLRGESGAGKEIAARTFHEASPRRGGPLVAVNCATIPKDLAERLLFGTVRGAYSGAVADAPGYLQSARGGTLFLDELAELDLAVQAKLLRVLETREVMPLGSTRAQPVEVGWCAATLRDLREAVSRGRFREDLYYRIGRPEVLLPPLRERREEIPFLVDLGVRGLGLRASVSLVEECLRRAWPGNVRELSAEVRAAAALAAAEGSDTVLVRHLGGQGGSAMVPEAGKTGGSREEAVPDERVAAVSGALGLARKTVLKLFTPAALRGLEPSADGFAARARTAAKDALLELLAGHDFQQSAVAAALGMSRTTLLKLMSDLDLPRANELDDEAIARACEEARGDLDGAARRLGVSAAALRKRRSSRSAG